MNRKTVEKVQNKSLDVINNSFALIFVRVLTMSVSIVQTMILSRTLTKTDYGTYSQALLIISFVSPFFSLGLENAVNYFFNKSEDAGVKKKFVNTIFFLSSCCGLLCGLLLLVFRNLIGDYFENTAILGLIIYIAFRPCLQNLIALYQPLFISSGYAKTIAIRNLILSLAQIGIVGGISLFFGNVIHIFALLLLLDIIQFFVFALVYRKRRFAISVFKVDFSLIKEILIYAFPMLLATSIGTISINIDKLMISRFMSIEDYALYSNVSKELPFAFIASSFTAVVTPLIIRYIHSGESGKFKSLWKGYLELGYKVTWPLCMGAAILAPEMIEVLYSRAYLSSDGIAVFRIYTVAAMLRFTYFGMIPTALGRTDVVLKYSGISCALNAGMNYPMYCLLGMSGPALATVISMVISASLYFRTSVKMIGVSLKEVFDPFKVMRFFLEMIICGVIVRLLLSTVEIYFNNVIINLVLGYAIFNGMVFGVNIKNLKFLIVMLRGGDRDYSKRRLF